MDGNDDNAGHSHPYRQAAGADGGNTGELLYPRISVFIHKSPIGPSGEDQVMGDVENDGVASNGPQTTPPPAHNDSSMEDSAPPGRWQALQKQPYLSAFTQRFNEFLVHKDIDKLEADLKAALPTVDYSPVEEFVATMDMWLQGGTTEPPYELAWTYINREMAARAREEAVEAQDQLL